MTLSIRSLIEDDAYAATFQTMAQYRSALLATLPARENAATGEGCSDPINAIRGAIAFGQASVNAPPSGHWLAEFWRIGRQVAAPDLEGLADRLLGSSAARREDGFLVNPAFPTLDEGENVGLFLEAFNIECAVSTMQYDCDDEAALERYFEHEEADCSAWTPTPPEGEGWMLSDIYDTEDGPQALFLRRKPKQKPTTRRERMAAAQAAKAANTAAARDVLAERFRQVATEGWTPSHDDAHDAGDLSAAASAYSVAAADKLHALSLGDGKFDETPPDAWPWNPHWWKPTTPRRDLVKAGALILAEIERIDRAALLDNKEANG